MSSVNYDFPSQWKTFDDRVIQITKLDHQHLSNIFWYYKLVVKDLTAVETLRPEFNRFNGQILSYQPHVEFTQELEWLEKYGHLIWDGDRQNAIIIENGKQVGSVRKPF